MEATYFASSARTLDNLDFCQFSATTVVLILSSTRDFVFSVSPISALQDQQSHRFCLPQPETCSARRKFTGTPATRSPAMPKFAMSLSNFLIMLTTFGVADVVSAPFSLPEGYAATNLQRNCQPKQSDVTPKGSVYAFAISISSLVFRQSLGSTCQTAITELCVSSSSSWQFAEIVVAVGSIDLVVGELDR